MRLGGGRQPTGQEALQPLKSKANRLLPAGKSHTETYKKRTLTQGDQDGRRLSGQATSCLREWARSECALHRLEGGALARPASKASTSARPNSIANDGGRIWRRLATGSELNWHAEAGGSSTHSHKAEGAGSHNSKTIPVCWTTCCTVRQWPRRPRIPIGHCLSEPEENGRVKTRQNGRKHNNNNNKRATMILCNARSLGMIDDQAR